MRALVIPSRFPAPSLPSGAVRVSDTEEPWRPEPGDVLRGRLSRRYSRNGPDGRFSVWVLCQEDGRVRSVAYNPAVQLIDNCGARRGETVLLQYLGWVEYGEGRQGRGFALWTCPDGQPQSAG